MTGSYKKFSEFIAGLPSATSVSDSDDLYVLQGIISKKVPPSLIGGGGGGTGTGTGITTAFDTRTIAIASDVDPSVNIVTTYGYRAPGDGGGATFKRVSSINPSKAPYSFSTNGGTSFWEYVPEPLGWNAQVAGVYADGVTEDSAYLQASLLPFQDSSTILNGGSATATLLWPANVMILNHPLILCGNNGISIKIQGQSQSAAGGPVGTCLAWGGLNDYPSMFIIYGANQIIIDSINFISLGVGSTSFSNLVNTVHVNADNTMNNFGFIGLTASVTAGTNKTFTCNQNLAGGPPNTTPGLQPGAGIGIGLGDANFEIVYVKAITSQTTFIADCVNSHVAASFTGITNPSDNSIMISGVTGGLIKAGHVLPAALVGMNVRISWQNTGTTGSDGQYFLTAQPLSYSGPLTCGEKVAGGTPCNNITFRRCLFATGTLHNQSACLLVGNQIQQTVQAAQVITDSCYFVGGIKGVPVIFSASSPCVVTDTAHGLTMGRAVKFTDSGWNLISNPTGLYYDPTYRVIPIDADHYHVAYSTSNFVFVTNGSAGVPFATLMPNASPGVVNWPAHGLSANTPLVFNTNGKLPDTIVGGPIYSSDITTGNTYYLNPIDADHFHVSATPGGANINFTGTQYGNHKIYAGFPSTGTFSLINTSGTSASGIRMIKGHSGFKSIIGGNVKNFFIFNTVFGHADYGVDGDPMSGSCEIFYPSGAGNMIADLKINAPSNLHVTSYETESSGQMFLSSIGSGGVNITLVQNSYQSGTPPDGYVIKCAGSLTMINNIFMNGTQQGPSLNIAPKINVGDVSGLTANMAGFNAVVPVTASISTIGGIPTLNITSVPAGSPSIGYPHRVQYMQAGADFVGAVISGGISGTGGTGTYSLYTDLGTVSSRGMTITGFSASCSSSVTSIGNYFAWAGGTSGPYIYYDGSGNPYAPNNEFPTPTFPIARWRVQQFNDYGDFGPIPNSMGSLETMMTCLGRNAQGSGLINISQGQLAEGLTTVKIPYTSINSGTTNDIIIGAVPERTKIIDITVDVKQVFTGAGTTMMMVGTTAGGLDLLRNFDCTTLKPAFGASPQGDVKGLDDADFGSNLQRATMPTVGGYCPGWTQPAGGFAAPISVRFTAGTGSLSSLTAGFVTVYVTTRRFN